MKTLSKFIVECGHCGYYWGFVDERYNGIVPVFCHCDLASQKAFGANPAIIGLPDGRLVWRPTSGHRAEDGEIWHTPAFALGSSLPTPKWKKKEEKNN